MDPTQHDLLAVVSHELRTPLGAIAGWVRLLRSQQLDPVKSAYAFDVIERSIKAQATLIDDLMDVSRILNGNFRLQVQEVNMAAILKSGIDTLQLAAEEKKIRIVVAADSDVPLVAADPSRLQQVICNLVSNAIKFTPSGGTVWVELHRNDSDLEIHITDTGRGIEPEFLPFVFERFRQEDNAVGGREGGLGLGLAIVREIIELHCGTVSAHSEGKGKGATFTVRLPFQCTKQNGSRAYSTSRTLSAKQGILPPPNDSPTTPGRAATTRN